MTVSSRTPEGEPVRCRVCGKVAALEPSDPGGDVICPSCGVLAFFRNRVGVRVTRDSLFLELDNAAFADSLDYVDLVMELEESLRVKLPDDAVERFHTVGDIIDYIDRSRAEGGD